MRPNKNDLRLQELLNRQLTITDDIRFIKDQQWRVLYHTLLFDAAAVAAFQLNVDLAGFYPFAKWTAFGIVLALGIVVLIHFITLAIDLDLTRLASDNIERKLLRITHVEAELNRMRDGRWFLYARKARFPFRLMAKRLTLTKGRSFFFFRLYNLPFMIVHIIGTATACIIIAFDK